LAVVAQRGCALHGRNEFCARALNFLSPPRQWTKRDQRKWTRPKASGEKEGAGAKGREESACEIRKVVERGARIRTGRSGYHPGGYYYYLAPVAPKWRNVWCHNVSQRAAARAFGCLFAPSMPMRTTMAKINYANKHVQRLNDHGLQSGHYRQPLACSNPKWPVEWVANWPIIPQSASTRG
jgi:hypothetical protein